MTVLLLGVALHYFTWQGRRGNGTSWHDKSGHGWTRPGRAVHGRNVMVRQLRIA